MRSGTGFAVESWIYGRTLRLVLPFQARWAREGDADLVGSSLYRSA